jgi:peptide-methionine (S)-S-oxide reductase
MEKNGKTYQLATFAGGCFWGLELAFQRVTGVEYTGVGYTQGRESEPNYDAVCAG